MVKLLAILLSANLFAQQQVVNVFIGAGQSNMQGYGNRTQLAPVPAWAQNAANGWAGAPAASSDTGIQYPHPTLANSTGIYMENWWVAPFYPTLFGQYSGNFQQPSGAFEEGGMYGPELSFLAKWQADHPGQQWAFLKIGVGGSSIADWLPGGSINPQWHGMIDVAKAQFTALGLTPNWAGLLWMQGENGATDIYHMTNPPFYADELRSLLAEFRAETSPTMPAVIGRIGNHLLADNIINPQTLPQTDEWHPAITAQMLREATNFRRAQQVLVGSEAGNTWVDTDNLPVLQDNSDPAFWYHHTGPGVLAMGERFYAGHSQAVPPPLPLGTSYTCTVTLNGQAVQPEQTTFSFIGQRPVLSIAGASVDRFTPWYFSCTASQQ